MSEAFWNFSLEFYAAPGVEESCLALQDRRGADVNLVLLALWAASRGRLLDTETIATAERIARPWRETVTEPIRAARRALKEPPAGFDGEAASALRRRLQALEIEAERLQQMAIAENLQASGAHAPAEAARGNLALYEAFLGKVFARAPVEALLAAFAGRFASFGGSTA